MLTYITNVAPNPLLPAVDPEPRLFNDTTAVPRCIICTWLLERPIQLGCGNIICLRCCSMWIRCYPCYDNPLSCPLCYGALLDASHVGPPPPLVLSMLEGVLVYCIRDCGKVVSIGQYSIHLESACKDHYFRDNSPTISDVLSRPSTEPTTPAEVEVAGHLVRKILDSSSNGVLQIPRRGQVSTTGHINIEHAILKHCNSQSPWWK